MIKRLEQDSKLKARTAQAIGLINDPKYRRPCTKLDSGYTYIGQFISHELTPITDPYKASRKVSGTMDLQSLYGNAHNYQLQHITEQDLFFYPNGCFKFDANAKLDFVRNSQGIAVIPEQRNDHHVIIAQMHMFWQRLHNLFIAKGFAANALEAKKLLVLTFQMMVIEDYLRQILDTRVYHSLFVDNQDIIKGDLSFWQDVFRYATFKFGHSTIRDNYSLRLAEDDPCSGKKLHELFLDSRAERKLNSDDYIDWRAFFCLHGKDRFEGWMPIDTRICGFMAKIPNRHGLNSAIAERNLDAELAAGLPSGLEVACKVQSMLPANLLKDCRLLTDKCVEQASFGGVGLQLEDLTIWLYTLLEAQLSDESHRLGIMASCINGHVIKQSIVNAQLSVFHHGRYDFDRVTKKMGEWGEILRSMRNDFSKADGGSSVRMKHLVNYLSKYVNHKKDKKGGK